MPVSHCCVYTWAQNRHVIRPIPVFRLQAYFMHTWASNKWNADFTYLSVHKMAWNTLPNMGSLSDKFYTPYVHIIYWQKHQPYQNSTSQTILAPITLPYIAMSYLSLMKGSFKLSTCLKSRFRNSSGSTSTYNEKGRRETHADMNMYVSLPFRQHFQTHPVQHVWVLSLYWACPELPSASSQGHSRQDHSYS